MAESQQPITLALKGQYIKDVSFENPRAPQSLLGLKEPPSIDVNLNLTAQRLQEELFELTIKVTVRAQYERSTLFLVDLDYAGLFEITGAVENQHEPLMLVDCAFLLFPFARRVVADLTRDGGFPPLQLDPVDFAALYRNNRQQVASG